MPIIELFLAGPYNMALIVALVVGILLAVRAGTKAGFPTLSWHVLLTAAIACGLIGSTFIFLDFHAPRIGEKSNLGGLIAGIAAVVVLAPWLRIGALRALDAMTVPTLVSMAIGRVGCFLAGCCSGTHTNLPWGVHTDDASEAVHPVQLYEAIADILLVAVLTRRVPIGRPGRRLGVGVVAYAGIRFATEFVRAGRADILGLNPVQWSVLAIGVAVAMWMWWHARDARGDVPVTVTIGNRLQTEQRAVVTAVVMMLTVSTLVLGSPMLFAPFEAVFLTIAAFGVACYAVFRHPPRWLGRPLMPSLCALFLLDTPPDSVDRKREILVGGGVWTGRSYSAVVGETRSLYTDCDGSTATRVDPTYARRRSLTGWFTGGIRNRTASGKRVSIEGQLLTGTDKLQSLGEGALFGPVLNTASILAGGVTLTLEGRNQHLRANALGGKLSASGTREQVVTGSVTGRYGVESGFFVEGNVAPSRWYAATGDFSYGGVGYMLNPDGARVMIGVGEGSYVGVHVPVRGSELDITGRQLFSSPKHREPSAALSVGVKTVLTLR